MPFTEIDIQLFTSVAMLKPENGSHALQKGILAFSQKIWFCKEVSDPMRARYEILSQEFYRLLNPEQPQYYLAKDYATNQYYVLSEEVSGFSPIPFNKKIRLTKGVYTGLGQILVLAIFLHEIDLNLGNLGVNKENTIIKIDGDWSFASLIRPDLFADKSSEITLALLQNLPKVPGYFAYNWLDIFHLGVGQEGSDLFAEELGSASSFRFEIHQALLFIILLPPAYLRKLVDFYIPENTTAILDFLVARQGQLHRSAMQDPLFVDFLSTMQASIIGRTYLHQLSQFTIHDNAFLHRSEKEALTLHCHTLGQTLKLDLLAFNARAFSRSMDVDGDSLSSTSSFASVDNVHRLFTPSPADLRSASSGTLKFNRTCSNLSQLSENNS